MVLTCKKETQVEEQQPRGRYCSARPPHKVANMLKKLFKLVILFAAVSVACYVVLLLFVKNNRDHIVDALPAVTEHRDEQLGALRDVDAAGGPEKNEADTGSSNQGPGNKTLEPCPETPPGLVGPLLVEFTTERSLDELRTLVGSELQVGGRHKPPDCISQHKVAIIIPFRNRNDHLKHWLYYLHPVLIRQQLDYGVYIINQDGDGTFNRAKLMNVGYAEALKDYDYECFVFSDVDLVPLDDRNLYRCSDSPRHLAVAMDKFGFQLPYKTYFGGVSSMTKEQYLKINGFPNSYWGWGGEDDDIYNRIFYRKMTVSRPDHVLGKYRMIKHERDVHNEPNPVNPDKIKRTSQTMDEDGFNNLKYRVKQIVKDILYTLITVEI